LLALLWLLCLPHYGVLFVHSAVAALFVPLWLFNLFALLWLLCLSPLVVLFVRSAVAALFAPI
jgi:hypothetical protein